jgi:hypothetical protein
MGKWEEARTWLKNISQWIKQMGRSTDMVKEHIAVDQSTLVFGKMIMSMVVAKWSMQTALSIPEIGKMVSPKRNGDNCGSCQVNGISKARQSSITVMKLVWLLLSSIYGKKFVGMTEA